jgi:FkbM family methyltransferase
VILDSFERVARVARGAGLGAVVDRVGPAIGAAAARREVEVDGFRLSGNHAGQLFYLRELATERREGYLAELVASLTPAGGVAVDAGAHIGYLTLQLARAVGPRGRVIAFEPDPGSRRALARNLRRNGMSERVVVRSAALADRPGTALLHVSGGGETSSLADPGTARETLDVELTTLDEALQGLEVDVVKLDIEGGEPAAIAGMETLLARTARPLTLFVECNPTALAAAGSSADELRGRIADAGFRILQIDEERRRLVAPAIPTDDGAYVNLLCVRGTQLAQLAA